MNNILNLTQHVATPEQLKEGVVEPDDQLKVEIKRFLTFDSLPSRKEIKDCAENLAQLARNEHPDASADGVFVMIGGAPYLMGPLEKALKEKGCRPVYSFSERVSEEITTANGVEKRTVFKHVGFVY